MKLIQNTIALITAIAVLAGLGIVVAVTGRAFVTRAAALRGDVANATFVVSAVVLASAWLIARAVAAASRRTRATVLREEQAATYQLLVDYWVNRVERPAPHSAAQTAELEGKLQTLERLLAMYGSAAVIAAHTRLREREWHDSDARAAVGDLLVAVRKDLGTETPHNMAAAIERLLLPAADRGSRLHAVQA